MHSCCLDACDASCIYASAIAASSLKSMSAYCRNKADVVCRFLQWFNVLHAICHVLVMCLLISCSLGMIGMLLLTADGWPGVVGIYCLIINLWVLAKQVRLLQKLRSGGSKSSCCWLVSTHCKSAAQGQVFAAVGFLCMSKAALT